MPPAIQLQGITQRFKTPRNEVITAVENISLTVETGEFITLIGPSGCGKSTLLRIIGDLLPPTQGVALVNGNPPRTARLGRSFGMVFQQPLLYEWRTVQKNVELPLEIMDISPAERSARAQNLLNVMELANFADHHVWQLSGGMQQRVSMARALAIQPSILLMDEPFGALDEMTRERMNNELLGIWHQMPSTVVFITHSIPEAVYLSSRVVVMSPRPGQIVADLPIPLARPRTPEMRETTEFFALVNQLRAALR
jgi:NitT/TauT family transport system ATP-binding protein